MESTSEKSWLQNLWDKKVPQYLGTYFAVGFGLLQFVEFLTKRYDLGDNLVDQYLLLWFTLVPAIITIIYFSDQLNPKTSKGIVRWPKFLIIGNFILSFFLVGYFNFKSQKENVEIVNLLNEDGKTVEAVVPNLKKIKTIASFQFINTAKDEDLDWWGSAFSNLLEYNLDQRPEFYTTSQYGLHWYYDKLSLPPFKVPNIGMQREIAKQSRKDYFTRISFTLINDVYSFKGNLYNVKDGNIVLEIDVVNSDPFLAIDEITEQIFNNIPNRFEFNNQVQLPSSSLITDNIEALKYFTLSRLSFFNNPTGLDEVVNLVTKSIELDPSCAICYIYLGDPLYGQGKGDESILNIKKAIKFGASLPERMQFYSKEMLYGITNDMDAYFKLQELRRKMFPYEFSPYERLLPLYQSTYGVDSAKVLIHEAIDYGNIEKGLLSLYELQLDNEEYIEAKNTLDKLSAEFPTRDEDKMKYADIFEKQGNLEKAKLILEEEETLDPLNSTIQMRLAYIDFKNSEIKNANNRLERSLAQSTTLTDSLSYIWLKANFLRLSGQINKSLELVGSYEKFGVKKIPLNVMIRETFDIKSDLYYSIKEVDKPNQLLSDLKKYSPEAESIFKCICIMNVIEKGYLDNSFTNEFKNCREEFKAYSEGYAEIFDVINFYQLGDYEKSIEILERDNGRIKKFFSEKTYFLSQIYKDSGDRIEALNILEKSINQKSENPIHYYLMASLLENENKQRARKYLNIAMHFWENADDEYIPLQKAKALSKRLLVLNNQDG